jgi:hypothetical protein
MLNDKSNELFKRVQLQTTIAHTSARILLVDNLQSNQVPNEQIEGEVCSTILLT